MREKLNELFVCLFVCISLFFCHTWHSEKDQYEEKYGADAEKLEDKAFSDGLVSTYKQDLKEKNIEEKVDDIEEDDHDEDIAEAGAVGTGGGGGC